MGPDPRARWEEDAALSKALADAMARGTGKSLQGRTSLPMNEAQAIKFLVAMHRHVFTPVESKAYIDLMTASGLQGRLLKATWSDFRKEYLGQNCEHR